jgi:hypothetical protein
MNPQCKTLRRTGLIAAIPLLIATALFAQDQDPPARVARIAYLQGIVSLQPSGFDSWNDAPPNYPMISGDRIYTDQNSRAVIQNGSVDVRLWAQTDVTLTNINDQYEQIGIAQGSVRVRVYGLNPGNVVEVDAPNAAVIIQQPGDYRINVYNSQASLVAVNAGAVQITGPGINQLVEQGQAVQVVGANPLELGLVGMPPFDDLDRWSIDRDHHILNSISAQYVSRDIPGYDDLDDYGAWVVTPDYGPVWYPRAMPVGWQPYTIGHWAYVRPWGYTWIDDAPWGYAPFHYGRWAIIAGRWGWAPGPPRVVPVYSPALVAFVGPPPGASFAAGVAVGLAAWFPLGIAEPYVPWYHCTPNYVRTVNVTNINVTVIKNVTVINNYNTFINNTRTVTNVNQINVTNVNYVNRTHVYAVPANTFSSGARVQQAAVHLNEQQRQQLVSAPVVVAKAPAPEPARPILQPRPNVSRPAARPSLMTPHGSAPATPAANKPSLQPVSLPKPQPAAAIKPAAKPVAPGLKPAAPAAARPATPIQPTRPTPPVNNTKPVPPPANSHPAPTTPETHPTPSTQPSKPAPPAKAPPANNTHPAPAKTENRPAPSTQPVKPAPANNPHPAPAPQTHPQQPQAHPAAQPHPQAKTPPKEQNPDEKKKPEEEKKPEDEKQPQ